jgi:hypothetical protein
VSSSKEVAGGDQPKCLSHREVQHRDDLKPEVYLKDFLQFYTQIRYSLPGFFHMWKA